MAKKSLNSKIRTVMYVLLSFVLSLVLFATSCSVILMSTVFNKDFVINTMNESNYYMDKADEITVSLTDLGYASGLKEEFFDDLISDLLVSNDTKAYLDDYYSGVNPKMDKNNFIQHFNEKLDEYIEENNIQNVSSKHRERLVKEATKIYVNSIQLPFFGKLFPYFKAIKTALPFVVIGLVIVAALICLVLFSTNKWKHRAYKYVCYAASTTFLSLLVIPAYLYFSNVMVNINLSSRAFYNFVLQAVSSLEFFMVILAVIFLLVAVALFIMHSKKRKSVQNND